jgi:hypothetical protein
MDKRFIFTNNAKTAWIGPFRTILIPRRGESVTVKCRDKEIRTGRVTRVHYNYHGNEIDIYLKQ